MTINRYKLIHCMDVIIFLNIVWGMLVLLIYISSKAFFIDGGNNILLFMLIL